MSENEPQIKELTVDMQTMVDTEKGQSGVRMATEDEAITITLLFPIDATDEQMAQCVAMVQRFPEAVVEAMTRTVIEGLVEALISDRKS